MSFKCEFCLISDRKLEPLKTFSNVLKTISIPLKLKGEQHICWECKAYILRILKFHQQIREAQKYFYCISSKENLSSLTITNKMSYDFEFEHKELKAELYANVMNCSDNNNEDIDRIDSDIKYDIIDKIEESIELNHDLIQFSDENDDTLHIKNNITDNTKSLQLNKELTNETNKHYGINSMILDVKNDIINNEHKYLDNRYKAKLLTEKEILCVREQKKERKRYKLATFKCDSCILGYFHEDLYKKHILKLHYQEVGKFNCIICLSKFKDDVKYNAHLKKHLFSYICKICGNEFYKLENMLRHYENFHYQTLHSCKECHKEFSSQRKLRYHRNTIHKEAPKCNICNRLFSTNHALKLHLEIHTGMPTYSCNICNKSYRGKHGLRSHIRSIHEGKDNPENSYCVQCDKQFSHVSKYLKHLKNNLKHRQDCELKYKCKDCDLKFYTRSMLLGHRKLLHMGLQKYYCHFCSKNYSRKDFLVRHIRSRHSGNEARKHICAFCKKGFVEKSTLINHIRTHTGERPFECSQCPSKFSQKTALQTHIKRIHLKIKRVS